MTSGQTRITDQLDGDQTGSEPESDGRSVLSSGQYINIHPDVWRARERVVSEDLKVSARQIHRLVTSFSLQFAQNYSQNTNIKPPKSISYFFGSKVIFPNFPTVSKHIIMLEPSPTATLAEKLIIRVSQHQASFDKRNLQTVPPTSQNTSRTGCVSLPTPL